ncbi:MAG: hypothetical protein AB7U82_16300 [Blastocatellales bacterium]
MQRHRSTTHLFLAFIALLLTATFAQFGFAQNAQAPAAPKYALFEYMKIEPGKGADYRKLEQEVWMPIHRERVKAKLIRSWALWGVRYPGGASREYDVVAITLYDNFKDLENSYPAEVFTKAHPNMNTTEMNAKTSAARKMVRTEVLAIVDAALPGAEDPRSQPGAAPAKYARFDYKKIEFGKANEYVSNERKYYKPFWQEHVNQNAMRGWAVVGARFPGGTDREYGFITIQAFDKFEQLEGNTASLGAWVKANPNINAAEITAKMGAISKTVRTEVLTLIDQVR